LGLHLQGPFERILEQNGRYGIAAQVTDNQHLGFGRLAVGHDHIGRELDLNDPAVDTP
jgi:hypothetical protein